MTIIKNILVFIGITAFTAFLLMGTFVFGSNTETNVRTSWPHEIKKSIVSITTDLKWVENLKYLPYKSGSTSTGIINLDFWRLSTAFIISNTSSNFAFSGITSSWTKVFTFEKIQGILSLYDPFSIYSLSSKDHTYQIDQITNGSFYISDEPDGTVSIYSIDAVVGLSFFYNHVIMTDMILFPGMYIRFDPQATNLLKWADLFKIMLVLSDINNTKITGLEFVNPRVTDGDGKDVFFMFKLPVATKPLFHMLNVLFADRIAQVESLKKYVSNKSYTEKNTNSMIYNPSKKNFYLLEELRSILSRTTQAQMDSKEFSRKIKNIYAESKLLVNGNSVSTTLQWFLTDTRFVLFWKNPNTKFGDIYIETANILEITPSSGKWKFFQYLSDIYSRNIALQKRDPTFSGIDTYTPTAEWLLKTIEVDNNDTIESKDYFDIALYAYQLLQKAQDGKAFTEESLLSKATYDLINTLFLATEKYIKWLKNEEDQKSAYQALIIQFYLPMADAITRSFYGKYVTHIDQKIFLDKKYLDGDVVKFDEKIRENISLSYSVLQRMYDQISAFFGDEERPDSVISFRDSVLRMEGFTKMIAEWNYKEYQSSPYAWIDVDGVFLPEVNLDGKLELYKAPPVVIKPIETPTKISMPPLWDMSGNLIPPINGQWQSGAMIETILPLN